MNAEDANELLRTRGRGAVTEASDRAAVFDPADCRGLITPKPWAWADPTRIPKREWLYGRYLLRNTLSVTVAPGGVGKSILSITEALAMAIGRPLLGVNVINGPHRAWYINLEDPVDELRRRVAGACKRFGVARSDLDGRLFVNSGIEEPMLLAEQNQGGKAVLNELLFEHLEAEIRKHSIDVMILDPFVSTHDVSENDNMAIDRVAKRLIRLAERCRCAVAAIHHVRKTGGQEYDAESARGASALVAASRITRVINPMTDKVAETAGVPPEKRRFYFRASIDKQNLAPPETDPNWYQMDSVDLGNGDTVGIPSPWRFPSEFSGIDVNAVVRVQDIVATGNYRQAPTAADWVGHAIAETLDLDSHDPADKRKITRLVKSWLSAGALRVELEMIGRRGRQCPFIRVGKKPQ